MRHARTDYDAIQDTTGQLGFGPEEPVFILRAKDKVAPAAVDAWAEAAQLAGADPGLLEKVRAWADRMRAWQKEHGSKTPDTPAGLLR